jgi:hypothetical protein
MDFKGMFGEPKRLCTEATRRLCNAIEFNAAPEATQFILMNSVGGECGTLNSVKPETGMNAAFCFSCANACLRTETTKLRPNI